MSGRLKQAYLRLGLQTAAPGTLLYRAHEALVTLALGRQRRPQHSELLVGSAQARPRVSYYDIVRARSLRRIDGLALIFFMGLGDYLMVSPLIDALHRAHPDLPLHALVSSHVDPVNSPLVAHFLRANPAIEHVATFDGRPGSGWTNYDYSDALTRIPRGFLPLPVFYGTNPLIPHRVTAVMDAFGLQPPWPVPPPVLARGPASAIADGIGREVLLRAASLRSRGVVGVHFGARSSGYTYPHANKLVRRLAADGYFVVDLSNTGVDEEGTFRLDLRDLTPLDTVDILAILKAEGPPLRTLSVNSVMWPISAGLGIYNLGLHVFRDPSVHQYLYPNTFVLTPHAYPTVSASRLFLARPDNFETRVGDARIPFFDYDPDFVLSCFTRFMSAA